MFPKLVWAPHTAPAEMPGTTTTATATSSYLHSSVQPSAGPRLQRRRAAVARLSTMVSVSSLLASPGPALM